jgi:hypothetical protein
MLVELRRGTRKRETDTLKQYLAAEKADNDGNPAILFVFCPGFSLFQSEVQKG